MKKLFLLILAVLITVVCSNAKPKDYDLSKGMYFDPTLPYSICKFDIELAGYRETSIDTLGVISIDAEIKIEYKLYRDIFSLQAEKIYFTIKNDTISIIDIYIDVEKGQNAKNIASFIKNQKNNYLIYSNIDYDESSCGEAYEYVVEHDLRHQIFFFYIPIDYEVNYLKIKILPNNTLGQSIEDINDIVTKATKSKKKKKNK